MRAAAGMRHTGSTLALATAAHVFPSQQVVVAERRCASLESAGGDSSLTGADEGRTGFDCLNLQIASLLFRLCAVKPKETHCRAAI